MGKGVKGRAGLGKEEDLETAENGEAQREFIWEDVWGMGNSIVDMVK